MRNLGMRELMMEFTGKNGPATHIRGTTTIDGVFATSGIVLKQGRYVPFHTSPGDHRWIVLDIDEHAILGTKRYDRCTRLTRKVTSKMPSIKITFQQLLEQQILLHSLPQKIQQLYDKALTHTFDQSDKALYEQVELRMQRAVAYADRHCRKVRRGSIPFSPEHKRLMGGNNGP